MAVAARIHQHPIVVAAVSRADDQIELVLVEQLLHQTSVIGVVGRATLGEREILARRLGSEFAAIARHLGHVVAFRHPVEPASERLGEGAVDDDRLGLRDFQRVVRVPTGQDAPDRIDVRIVVERPAKTLAAKVNSGNDSVGGQTKQTQRG